VRINALGKRRHAVALDFELAFQRERLSRYPAVDAFEKECGCAVDLETLESAARVLACPLKVNPPNWQHGRVIYAAYRSRAQHSGSLAAVDVGTAKGFSALCARWALDDAGHPSSSVTSIDVIDPSAATQRNTVREVDGLKTLYETLEGFAGVDRITFVGGDSTAILEGLTQRVGFAFVDGKHSFHSVYRDAQALTRLQKAGDVIVFDDVQISAVREAVALQSRDYALRELIAIPGKRSYVIGRRR
jgi:predicted O-methyltransferase YrrM